MQKKRQIMVGPVAIGGDAPVTIQSMTNTETANSDATLKQIYSLHNLGCEIIRVALPNLESVNSFREIINKSPIPVIADIHFDHKLALLAMENGAAAIRINPGNIRNKNHLRKIADSAIQNNVAIRIGVNSGSLDPKIYAKYKKITPEALSESAFNFCSLFEGFGCQQLKVSIKASNVPTTVAANRIFANQTDYPIHLGITETGTLTTGIIKSATGIGCLLLEGIGNTLRVSLTAPPEEEIKVAIKILEAVGLREANPDIIACPTCGRTKINLLPLVTETEKYLENIKASGKKISLKKIAIMGCIVNGPGEAREADIGIAGGDGNGVLFKNGKIICKLPENELLPAIFAEIDKAIIK